MAILTGSKTHENLKTAFAQEAQANRQYVYYARQADIEGYPDIAGLFRDTAEGEAGHAQGHLDYLRKAEGYAAGNAPGQTVLHLKSSIAQETSESTVSYPEMAATARQEGFPDIADWFDRLARAEGNHAARLLRGLGTLR